MTVDGAAARRDFWATGVVFAANGASYGGFLPRIPEFADRLGITAQLVGVALFFVAVGSLTGSAVAPWVVRRIGPRRAVIASQTALALGIVLGVWTLDVPVVFAMFGLAGIGDGLMDVAMNVEAVEVERRRGGSTMHRFHAMWTVGVLGSSLLGAAVAGTVPLPVHIGLVTLVVWLAGLRAASTWKDKADAARSPVRLRGMPAMVIWAAVITAIGMLIEGVPYDWGALFLTERFAAEPALAGAGVVVVLTGAVLGRLIGDGAVGRLGPYRALAAFAGVATVGAAVAFAAGHIALAFAGMFITGFGGAFVFPAMMTLSGSIPGVAAETGVGTVSTVARIGFIASPLVAGTVAETYGVRTTFVIAIVAAVVTVVWALSVPHRGTPARGADVRR